MAGANGAGASYIGAHASALGVLAVATVISFTIDTPELWDRFGKSTGFKVTWAVVASLVFTLCLTRLSLPSPFLYFQF
jgi:hypothetical protein